jgi:hypothetical protein
MPPRDPVLEEALQRRRTTARIAEAAGITHAAVAKWRRVPEHHLDIVVKITGVPRYLLRPDLFKRPAPRKAIAAKRLRVIAK